MSVRGFQMTYEAVYGVAAAGTYVAIPGSKFKPNRKQNRDKPKIITGTRWDFYETRKTNAEASWSLEMPLYYGMCVYPMALLMGAPSTATVFTSALAHTFKPGGNSILSGTFQYKKVSSQNTSGEWYQMTGCVANKMSLGMSPKGIPMMKFEGFGKYPTNISAPTAATLAIESYVHPDTSQASLTKGGSSWTKPTKLDVAVDQGFEPDWTIAGGVALARVKLGGASATIKATAFQDDYTGSVMETNDGSGLLSQLIAKWTGTDTIATAGVPSFEITAPLPYTDDANETDSTSDDEEDFSISLAYHAATASGIKFVVTNMVAAAVFTGS